MGRRKSSGVKLGFLCWKLGRRSKKPCGTEKCLGAFWLCLLSDGLRIEFTDCELDHCHEIGGGNHMFFVAAESEEIAGLF